MNPITFRPTEETLKVLRKEQDSRPGVPMTYIINEMIGRSGKSGVKRRTKSGSGDGETKEAA